MMLTRGTKDWRKKRAGKGGDGLFITCRSDGFNTTTFETATAVYLSKPEDVPMQISVRGNPEGESDFSDNGPEKVL